MNFVEISNEMYNEYLRTDYNEYNREFVLCGIEKMITHFTSVWKEIRINDLVDYYLQVYGIKSFKKISPFNDIVTILVPQENIELIFICDDADFNKTKKYIQNNMKVILICVNAETLVSIFKKDILLKILKEYDVLHYDKNEHKKIVDFLS